VSGIVGIVNFDGAPVNREILSSMTQFMAFRGPDAQRIWSDGAAGFGHTLLSTATQNDSEQQPASLDGKFWVTADARIDGRAELIEELRSKGSTITLSDPDHQLILHAYRVWGSACVEHLLGDFAFAVWDAETRRLFCARDQFGLKPFYYARIRDTFLFSNTLDCLRMHPEISTALNDVAIADFLLFDCNRELNTTCFRDILRLPPAHILECSREKVSTHRYWTLPEAEPIYFKRPQDCVDQFRELLDMAVSDRMRSNTACMALSGGLDSPTVAASARRVLDRRATPPDDLWSYTIVYKSVIPHEEGHYAGLVAKTLRIPVQQFVADEARLYGDFNDPNFSTPEPAHVPMGYSLINPIPMVVARGRVILSGYGADPVLASLRLGHIRKRIREKQFWQLAKDLTAYLSVDGRFSRLYLGGYWQKLRHPNSYKENYPEWLNPELEKRLNLRERWERIDATYYQTNNSVRPEAYRALTAPGWVNSFESGDAGATHYPVEGRHPFFDLRLVKFLLALPALPWCADKEILRRAMRGILPDEVRLRQKSPLQGDPIDAALQRPESKWVDSFEAAPELEAYVERSKIPRLFGVQDMMNSWVNLRPISLSFWLQRFKTLSYHRTSNSYGGSA
jgi:asparagine synthase (glutamine-hydrolysing)